MDVDLSGKSRRKQFSPIVSPIGGLKSVKFFRRYGLKFYFSNEHEKLLGVLSDKTCQKQISLAPEISPWGRTICSFFERCGLENFGGFVSNECGKLKDVLSEKSCRKQFFRKQNFTL